MAQEFEIKDLGQLKYFLGMEVTRSKGGISISQRKYTLDLLKETRMLGCKSVETPLDPTSKSELEEDSPLTDKGRFQRLVGKLIYLAHTRPDIGFAIGLVSRFMNKPTEKHLEAVLRILHYLKQSLGRGLYFRKTTSRGLEVLTEADWAGLLED